MRHSIVQHATRGAKISHTLSAISAMTLMWNVREPIISIGGEKMNKHL